MADKQTLSEAKKQKSRVRYLIPIILLVVVPALAFLAYDLVKPLIDPCESLFRQTQLSLDSKVSWLKSEGQLQLKPEKIQELSERAQFIALNLKSCCIVLDSGKVSPEEFLQCKASAFSYQQGLEKVVTLVKKQQALAKQPSKDTTVLALQAKLTETLELVKKGSTDFNKRIVDINKDHQYAELEALNREELEISNNEAEPNDSVLMPNKMLLDTWVSAEINNPKDLDVYLFTSPTEYRDYLQIELKNNSTSLRSHIDIYNSQKAHISKKSNTTAGGEIKHHILVSPSTSYFLQVSDFHRSASGRYLIKVSALKSYDQFEPNDNILSPTAIDIGLSVEANIMDGGDSDYYSFMANQAGVARVNIENKSTSLRPHIDIFNQQKAHIFKNSNTTAGGDINTQITLEAGQKYFLRVMDFHQSSHGKYMLVLEFE